MQGSASSNRQAEAAPEASAQPTVAQFRAIAEMHGDACFIVDCTSGVATYISPALTTMLGYDTADIARELAGTGTPGKAAQPGAAGAAASIPERPFAAICAGLPARLQRFADGDLTRLRVVRRFDQRRQDGSVVPLEVTSLLLNGRDGAASALVGMLRDNSAERERAEQQRRFTSMLNHEFRTPLSTIDGAIQRLEATGANADEPTRQRYHKIQAAVDRLIGMLDDYLSPDRMEEIGRTRQADGIAPCQLLDEAAAQVRAAGRAASIDCGDLPASVRCQPQGLRLALKVLVDNALQYGPADQAIMLSGACAEGGIVLAVADHGAGVPLDETTSIFDKGYRGSNAAGPGSGRGLYMARSVIEVHGGHISVESVAPKGARFKIWLPAQRGAGKKVAPNVSNSDNSANQHTREGAVRRD